VPVCAERGDLIITNIVKIADDDKN